MSVIKSIVGYLWWIWIPLLLLAAVLLWRNAVLPTAIIHYSKFGNGELKYIWNVQDRIYKGQLQPGGVTIDHGFLFPDDKFFMEIYWWSDNVRSHCVNITPKWLTTHIYLDANGDIDTRKGSGTDTDRLKQCITDTSRP